MGDEQTWRVVDELGAWREAPTPEKGERFGGRWTCEERGWHATPRAAVLAWAFARNLSVAEILAPGEATRAEAVAAAVAVETLRCIGVADALRARNGKHWTRAQHTAVAAVAWEMRPVPLCDGSCFVRDGRMCGRDHAAATGGDA